jgi:hypothetical protein
MKTYSPILAILLAATIPALAQDTLSLDEILDRHAEARGGYDKIRAIRTLVHSKGTYREPGFEGSGNAFMAHARPYFKRVGNPESPGNFSEGYDGSTWEWYQNPGVVVRTVGDAAAAGRHGNQLDGSLIDYRAKGSTATLEGIVEIGGRPAYQVTITMRDGFAWDYFIDTETWLVTAERMSASIHAFGAEVTREGRVSDYRRVAGVLFPFRFRETDIASGEMLSEMQWGSIEANRELSPEWFSPPEFQRTPVQRFVEQLYFNRDDPSAVIWTYEEFRHHYAEIEVAAAVEFAGYQMLKMGSLVAAVTLLEANLADNPHSASAAFGLGRAYATDGNADAARGELERALALDPDHRGATRALAELD